MVEERHGTGLQLSPGEWAELDADHQAYLRGEARSVLFLGYVPVPPVVPFITL